MALKIDTTAHKTMVGKRTGEYKAECAGHSVIASTRELAAAECETDIRDTVNHHATVRYVICGDGKTILVCRWMWNGWAYDIIDHERNGSCGCQTNYKNLVSVLDMAKKHAEQSYGGVVRVY